MLPVERWLGLELEFNPFSRASRAARGERAGRIAEALALYASIGEDERIRECLAARLPNWAIKRPVLAAADALLVLRASAADAKGRGIPATMTTAMTREVEATGALVWRAAHRIVAAAAQHVDPIEFSDLLAREGERLTRLAQAIQMARVALVKLTLSDGGQGQDLEVAEARLRALASARQEVESAIEDPLAQSNGAP